MNRLLGLLLVCLSLLFSGCRTPDIKYSWLKPATTATVSDRTVTLHIGSDMMNTACWTRPKVRVDASTIYVAGYMTIFEQNREVVVRLPAKAASQPVSVFWVDPHGTRVPVPISK